MAFPWYALFVLFVLPFIDPRRPLRLLHLDLVVLVIIGLGPLHSFLCGGVPSTAAIVVTVAGLTYLMTRLAWSALRPANRSGPLVPVVPVRWLAVAVVLLVTVRVGYVLADRVLVIDVGEASVAGADRIAHGRPLYEGGLGRQVGGGDTYGPVVYLTYLPFERVLPLERDSRARAARPAAVTFDLLTVAALFALGQRLRLGRAGKELGVALAYAWAAYPYSLLVLRYSFNDALVSLVVLGALLAASHPARRGALGALAAATKFAPAVVAPLLAAGTGERRPRSILIFAASFAVVTLAVFLPFLPNGGVHELYDRTLHYQQARRGWMVTWGRAPELDWLQTVVQVTVVGLAFLFAVVPWRKCLTQVAALSAALLIAAELAATNWFSTYTVWFAPLAFVGFFAAYESRQAATTAAIGTA